MVETRGRGQCLSITMRNSFRVDSLRFVLFALLHENIACSHLCVLLFWTLVMDFSSRHLFWPVVPAMGQRILTFSVLGSFANFLPSRAVSVFYIHIYIEREIVFVETLHITINM